MSRRILVVNPNSDATCTAGIVAALRPLAAPGLPPLEVVGLADGPPAIASWGDWFTVAGPLQRLLQREAAAAYVIACASDPALDLLRATVAQPVFGAFRAAVAAALARADRFGVIAFVEASKQRHARVLQAMGLEARLAGSVALGLPMAALTDPSTARGALRDAARRLADMGAGAVVLGCAGMAGHTAFVEDAAGLPVVEPCQAAAALALAAVAARGASERYPATVAT